MQLKNFTKKIPEFSLLNSSVKIDYFSYFLLHVAGRDGIKAKDIQECYDELHLSAYSNIPAYLNKFAKRGKTQKYIKRNDCFYLVSSMIDKIEKEIGKDIELEPTNSLYPIAIFDNTRGYLVSFAKEALSCYDVGLYNSCFFMIRKTLETLIIDLFERHGIDSKIKNAEGNYFFLSELIVKLVSETKWHISKTAKQEIPKIKKLADASVHSKKFSAKKPDIDNIKTELRIILEEFIHLIDYPNWKSH